MHIISSHFFNQIYETNDKTNIDMHLHQQGDSQSY